MGTIEPKVVKLPGRAKCRLRVASEEEAAAILEFDTRANATSAFAVREPGETRWTLGEQRASIKTHRDGPGHLLLLAIGVDGGQDDAGPIIGLLSFRCGERKKLAHHGHFGISVDADWRGKGVGTALIRTLLDWAADHPTIEKVCLGVFETNTRARALYERLGFVVEGRQVRFFKLGPGEYADDIQMSLFVKPGVAPEGFNVWARRGK
jgi:RimJ/RimL family protein N-acetyltransferase